VVNAKVELSKVGDAFHYRPRPVILWPFLGIETKMAGRLFFLPGPNDVVSDFPLKINLAGNYLSLSSVDYFFRYIQVLFWREASH